MTTPMPERAIMFMFLNVAGLTKATKTENQKVVNSFTTRDENSLRW